MRIAKVLVPKHDLILPVGGNQFHDVLDVIGTATDKKVVGVDMNIIPLLSSHGTSAQV